MTQPTERIRQLADEMRQRNHPDSYALGRIKGCVTAVAWSVEEKLNRIVDVLAAYDLALREPDPSPAAAAAPIEFIDAGTPAQFARALAASFDDDGYVDADVLASNITDQPVAMTGAEALDAAAEIIEPTTVKPHAVGNGEQRLYRFDNGYGASVVRFDLGGIGGSYGAEEGKWELAVLRYGKDDKYELTYDTPVTDDVIGWLSDDDVQEKLREIRALPAVQS